MQAAQDYPLIRRQRTGRRTIPFVGVHDLQALGNAPGGEFNNDLWLRSRDCKNA